MISNQLSPSWMVSDQINKLGIIGGTFDPIHLGHLHLASALKTKIGFDKVLLVVANDPWMKSKRNLTSANHRFEMVKIAVSGLVGVEASDLEIARGGVTYSADTLYELSNKFPNAELNFIIGSDLVEELALWDRVEEIFELAKVLVVTRPQSVESNSMSNPVPNSLASRLEYVELEAIEVSSTNVRNRLSMQLSVQGLVPANVIDYIAKHHLYSDKFK